MKQKFLIKVILVSFIALLSSTNLWAYDFEKDSIYYHILSEEEQTCEVTYLYNYSSSNVEAYSGVVNIPSSVEYNNTTYSVVAIREYAFYKCKKLEEVTIPNSVTSIGGKTFYDCSSLKGITIPNSVTSIGDYAFSDCTSMKTLTIEDGEETLAMTTSYDTTQFTNCPIETLYLGRDISFGDRYSPFRGNTSLKTLTLGTNVTTIYSYEFYGCRNLTNVTIPNGVTSIGSYAFYQCTSLSQLGIPGSVSSIGGAAFYGCTSLSQLTIPSSVSSIGGSAFYGCTGIKMLTIEDGNEPLSMTTSSSATPFRNCPIETLYLGRTISYSNDYSPFRGNTSLTTLTLGNNVTSIGTYEFYGCTNLPSVTIPNGVTSIGGSAFYNCASLSQLTIPNNILSIENSAFYGCTSMKILTIEDGSETLFITTSSSATLFTNCPIETLYLGRNISYNDNYSPFRNNMSLKTLTLGNKLTNISKYEFYGCTNITEVNLNNSVSSIDRYAFSGCTELSQLTIPNSVTSIGDYAFQNCTSLSQLTIPNNVTSLGDSAFGSCTNLQEVDYNATACDSAGSSSNPVFNGCSNLVNMLIGENVTTIPAYTFSTCTSLTKVTSLATTPPTIYSTTFDSKLVEAEVSKTSLLKYASDDVWSNIASIYAVENAVKLYPAVISYEGDAIIKMYGGDKNGIIVEEGENVTIVPIRSNKDLLGTIDYNGRDITATLIGDGTYSFEVSEYHKQNRIYSHYVDSDNAFDITLSNRGQLIDEISVSAINSVYSLRVKGDIDGTDIYTIRRLPNLQYLDLSQANIVSGGDAYYNDYETYNNTIGDYFFSDLSGLKLVKLPETALTIENYAFRNCTSLVCINLPSSLSSISSNAFSSCKNIEGINCPNSTPPDISSSTFSSVDKSICVLNVPLGSSSAYWLHKYWGEFKNIYEVDFDRIVNGIKDIPNVENTNMYDGDNYQIYTLSGTRVTTPIKGNVYIFKNPDGTTRKILVN